MTQIKDWYLGLDIGTASVGFAATDTEYNILTKNGKLQCGSRLFNEASTAAERRQFRSNRRRMGRRKLRIKLLNRLFEPVINEMDSSFFERLKESNLWREDKKSQNKYSLFADANFCDKDYYNRFPTIYHLRQHLLNEDETDPRLLYLACHHLIKYRGHFLLPNFNSNSAGGRLFYCN